MLRLLPRLKHQFVPKSNNKREDDDTALTEAVTDLFLEELFDLLECSICFHSLRVPIEQCPNGHNICKECRSKLPSCPTCRNTYSGIRNRTAEKIVEKLLYPCMYSSNGCTEKGFQTEIDSHNILCQHKPCKCFMKYCNWTGQKDEIPKHFKEAHKGCVFDNNKTSYVWKCVEFNREHQASTLLTVFRDTFLIVRKVDVEDKSVMWCVQLLGSPEHACDYVYHLDIQSGDKTTNISIAGEVIDDLKDINIILESKKCLELGIGMLKNFLNEDNELYYSIQIMKSLDDYFAKSRLPLK